MHVHARNAIFDRTHQVEVGRARQVGVNATLHAHFRRAYRPGLLSAIGHLLERQRERIYIVLTLSEGTETATGVTHVREVDVAVDDVCHLVADSIASNVIGNPAQFLERRTINRHQLNGQVVVFYQRQVGRSMSRELQGAREITHAHCCRGFNPLSHGLPIPVHLIKVGALLTAATFSVNGRSQVRAAPDFDGGVIRISFLPPDSLRDPLSYCQVRYGVAQGINVRAQSSVNPWRALCDVFGVDRQPLFESESSELGELSQVVKVRPRALRVDVIWSQWRNTAPVVDSSSNQPAQSARRRKIRRGLDAHLGP